ncbi:MAG: hypothetical protein J6B06_06240 [Lachnospiraceae bacterium]|nr:hypothetical protein [Lachnospiraceae bacterium]
MMAGGKMQSYVWIICLLAGIVIGIAGILLFRSSREDMSEYPVTEAEVCEISYSVTGIRVYKKVSLKYKVDGVEYISEYNGDSSNLEEGMRISVHYAPQEPGRLNPRANGGWLLLTVAGFILSICAVGFIIMGRRTI